MPTHAAVPLHRRIGCSCEGIACGPVEGSSLGNAEAQSQFSRTANQRKLTFLLQRCFRRIVDSRQSTQIQFPQVLGNPHIQLLSNFFEVLHRRLWLGVRRFLARPQRRGRTGQVGRRKIEIVQFTDSRGRTRRLCLGVVCHLALLLFVENLFELDRLFRICRCWFRLG